MATYNVNTDGISGDYSSLEAAINGIGGLTENTIIEYDTDAGADSTACTIDTTLNGYTLTIRNSGTDPKARLTSDERWSPVLNVSVACTLEDVEVRNTNALGGDGMGLHSTGSIIKNCVVSQAAGKGIYETGTNNVIVNTFVHSTGSNGIEKAASGGALYVYNCTIVDNGTYGVQAGAWRTVYLKNCYVGSSGTADLYEATDGTITVTTSYTSDGSLATTSAAYSTTSGAYFLDITPDELDDVKISSDSSLIGEGTDLSSDGTHAFDDDIYGTTRSSWDIGAYEYVSGGGGVTIPVFMHHYEMMRR